MIAYLPGLAADAIGATGNVSAARNSSFVLYEVSAERPKGFHRAFSRPPSLVAAAALAATPVHCRPRVALE